MGRWGYSMSDNKRQQSRVVPMAKKKAITKKSQRVRLQVPINAERLEQIDQIAKRLGRGRATVANWILETAIEDQNRITRHMYKVMIRTLKAPAKAATRLAGKTSSVGEEARLPVLVSQEVSEQVELLAHAFKNTPLRTAGWLIEQVLEDQGWIIELVTSRPMVAMADLFGAEAVKRAKPAVKKRVSQGKSAK